MSEAHDTGSDARFSEKKKVHPAYFIKFQPASAGLHMLAKPAWGGYPPENFLDLKPVGGSPTGLKMPLYVIYLTGIASKIFNIFVPHE